MMHHTWYLGLDNSIVCSITIVVLCISRKVIYQYILNDKIIALIKVGFVLEGIMWQLLFYVEILRRQFRKEWISQSFEKLETDTREMILRIKEENFHLLRKMLKVSS